MRISSGDFKAHQLNLGAHNGLGVQRRLGARYWVATHDEVKTGGGLMKWFINRTVYSVADALRGEVGRITEAVGVGGGGAEAKDKGEKDRGRELWESEGKEWDDVSFVELGNGEALVLT